ncbi:hypothetical protein EVAR_62774_1 [Eumeta japonica]|uniref:Uncharacterized protein n=1 Tax=Eumeta variegata TaxID=151549 RepID=A0A4C1Z5S3_EUMVA|nr:hypothetical protein EVAR_62774_1 [Eumeta japonica]
MDPRNAKGSHQWFVGFRNRHRIFGRGSSMMTEEGVGETRVRATREEALIAAHRNLRRVTSALLTSCLGIEYLMKGVWVDRGNMG